ncbi:MAG: AAA family ATPase [Phycisphaerales bacterium]
MHITRLELENWRNFGKVEVPLPSRAFLVGPNASGKSNLLDAIRFLQDVALPGGLEEAVKKRGGVSSLRCLAARQKSDIRVAAWLGDASRPNRWTYELVFNQDSQRNPVVKRERVVRDSIEVLGRPLDRDKHDNRLLSQTHLQQINSNENFREVVDTFASVRYLHLVPQIIREPDRGSGRRNDPFGADFLEQLALTQKHTLNARLKRIREALSTAVPQLRELELWRDQAGVPHLRGKYDHWRPQGAWQTEDRFSDGTLRLFGLLWSILDGSGPLLLEEPELSLHTEVVSRLPQLFARVQSHSSRQIITTTHSADLLRDRGIGLDEVLVLVPHPEGTRVKAAKDFTELVELVHGGLSLSDAVLPHTRPPRSDQLLLFGATGS